MYSFLSYGPNPVIDDDFRAYARLCAEDSVDWAIGAATEKVELFTGKSWRANKIEFTFNTANPRLPFGPVHTITNFVVVEKNGREKTLGARIPDLRAGILFTPALADGTFYKVIYKTHCPVLPSLVKMAIMSVASKIYDGQEVANLSKLSPSLLSFRELNKLEMYDALIGGITKEIS